MEKLRKGLGISSLKNTFEIFKPWPGTEKALATIKALALGKTTWKLALIYGGVGNGKTHLCEAAAIELYKAGYFCRVNTMDWMMSSLKRCLDPEPPDTLDGLLRKYSYAEHLIIDDVAGSVWEMEQLEKIIRARYRERLFTILTTNLDLKELPERVVSRFRDAEVARLVLNDGKDYRPQKGNSVESDIEL